MPLDPDKIKVGDVILVANTNQVTIAMQKHLGFEDTVR